MAGRGQPKQTPRPPPLPLVCAPSGFSVHVCGLPRYSYCCVLQHYNGDYAAEPTAASMLGLSISSALSGNDAGPDSPCSTGSVLEESLLKATSAFGIGGRLPALQGCFDVAALVGCGRGAQVCALWDMKAMFSQAVTEARLGSGGGDQRQGEWEVKRQAKQQRRLLQAAEHKLLFFAAFANEMPAEQQAELCEACGSQWERAKGLLEEQSRPVDGEGVALERAAVV